jgi:hypothetical protein
VGVPPPPGPLWYACTPSKCHPMVWELGGFIVKEPLITIFCVCRGAYVPFPQCSLEQWVVYEWLSLPKASLCSLFFKWHKMYMPCEKKKKISLSHFFHQEDGFFLVILV